MAPPAPPQDFNTLIKERPELQPYLGIPELNAIIREGVKENYSPERFYSTIIGTKWYKSTPQKARRWITLTPADQARERQAAQEKYLQFTREWWQPATPATARHYGDLLASGRVSEEDILADLRNNAKKAWPAFAKAIDRGATPSVLFDPWVRMASEELEVSPDQLIGDTRVLGSVFRGAATGDLPDQADFIRHVRSLPEWKETRRAEQLVNDWSERIVGGIFQEL